VEEWEKILDTRDKREERKKEKHKKTKMQKVKINWRWENNSN